MEGWDKKTPVDEQKEYLVEQMKIMKNLIEESDKILGDAKTKYDKAAKDIDSVNNNLESFKNNVNQLLDENTSEHDSWVAGIRAGVYATAGSVTAGMIIADIFGCLGFCSGIVTSSTWVASVASVESKIHEVEKKLGELVKTIENSVEDVDDIMKGTQDIQRFIQQETLIIIKWSNAADHLSDKLEHVKEENFYRLSLKRNSFTNALKGLRDVAQEFWDRPDGIFGENLLDEKLKDPEERAMNLKAIKDAEEVRASLK